METNKLKKNLQCNFNQKFKIIKSNIENLNLKIAIPISPQVSHQQFSIDRHPTINSKEEKIYQKIRSPKKRRTRENYSNLQRKSLETPKKAAKFHSHDIIILVQLFQPIDLQKSPEAKT